MLSESIKKLVQYGVESGITPECERIYATNLLLDAFGESEYTEPETEYAKIDLEETLNELLDEAVKRGNLFRLLNSCLQACDINIVIDMGMTGCKMSRNCMNCNHVALF